MAVFEYIALDARGREKKGIVEADGPAAARRRLRASGLYPSSLTESKAVGGADKTVTGRWRVFARRVRRQELTVVTRQLATLLAAGLPLVTALDGVIEQMEPSRLRLILAQVKDRVNGGAGLAEALEEHGRAFPPTFAALVRAGEASGTLEAVMEQLADFEEARLELSRRIQSTLAYPMLMLLTGLAVVFFLMIYVIPKLTSIFQDYGQSLPLPTVLLIAVSNFLSDFWPFLLLFTAAVFFLWRLALQRPVYRMRWDAFVLRAPLFGPVIRQAAAARFTGTLGTLIRNDVPLLTALDIVRSVVHNVHMAQAIKDARQEITEGESIVGPLKKRQVFPPTVIQMIAAGEQSGNLDMMLLRAAEVTRAEVKSRLAMLTSLLEPVMILALGAVVGFVVLATLLPIFSMSHLVH